MGHVNFGLCILSGLGWAQGSLPVCWWMQIYDYSEGITLIVHCLEWYQYDDPFFESYTTQTLCIAYNRKEVIDKCPGKKCSAHFADNMFSCFLLMSF